MFEPNCTLLKIGKKKYNAGKELTVRLAGIGTRSTNESIVQHDFFDL